MERSASSGQRLLVVDDDLMMRELLTTRLSLAGYEVFQARDGREAIDALRRQRPAGMVLDINMPGVSGFDVLRHLDDSGTIENLAVMVLTARNQAADVRRALGLGARDYLTKPFDDQQLLARVARLMRTASSRYARID